jgi:hypothetical protein
VIGFAALAVPLSCAWGQAAQDAQGQTGTRGDGAELRPSLRSDPRATGLRGTTSTPASPGLPGEDATSAASATGPVGDSSDSTNYGRPRTKPPKLFAPKSPLYAPDARVSPPLAPLMPYATAPGTKKRNSNAPASPFTAADKAAVTTAAESAGAAPTAPAVPPPTVSVLPWIPPPLRPRLDDKPFDPLGVDVGTMRLLPVVELSSGYDTNPNRLSSEVKGSPYARAAGGLDVNSQWDTHSLVATLRGGYSDYFSFHEADRPDAQAKAIGRVDVTRDTILGLEGRFTLDTQQPGSQQLAIPGSSFIVGRPLIETFGATPGITQNFGRLSLRLRGTYDRFQYQDATLSNGSILALSENDYNDIGINGRASYELTPGFVPYVDVTGDERLYDSLFDSSGFIRSSMGIAGKIGTTFDITRDVITGDLAAGYTERHYDDPRLINAKGPTIDGSIIWRPSALTTATVTTATDFVETTLANSSAAISRRVSLQLAHSFFRNFTLTGIGTFQVNNYVGQPVAEHLYTGSLLAEYSLTRDIVLRATYRHERFISTQLESNFVADVFLLGVRLQR